MSGDLFCGAVYVGEPALALCPRQGFVSRNRDGDAAWASFELEDLVYLEGFRGRDIAERGGWVSACAVFDALEDGLEGLAFDFSGAEGEGACFLDDRLLDLWGALQSDLLVAVCVLETPVAEGAAGVRDELSGSEAVVAGDGESCEAAFDVVGAIAGVARIDESHQTSSRP
jgi:hypothetical protein